MDAKYVACAVASHRATGQTDWFQCCRYSNVVSIATEAFFLCLDFASANGNNQSRNSLSFFFCLLPSLIFNHEKVLAFLLPHNSGEKMQTIFTGNLAYFLLLTTMIELTPHTSEHIPILAKFFVLIIGVGMFGAMLCACVIRLHKANDSKGNRNKRRCCISARTLNDIFFIMLVLHILKTKSWD